MRKLVGVGLLLAACVNAQKDAEIFELKAEITRLRNEARSVEQIDKDNIAACQRAPQCKDKRVPEGHATCIEIAGVRWRLTPAEAAAALSRERLATPDEIREFEEAERAEHQRGR